MISIPTWPLEQIKAEVRPYPTQPEQICVIPNSFLILSASPITTFSGDLSLHGIAHCDGTRGEGKEDSFSLAATPLIYCLNLRGINPPGRPTSLESIHIWERPTCRVKTYRVKAYPIANSLLSLEGKTETGVGSRVAG